MNQPTDTPQPADEPKADEPQSADKPAKVTLDVTDEEWIAASQSCCGRHDQD